MQFRPARTWPLPFLVSLLILAVQSRAGGNSSSPPAWLDRLPHSQDRYIGIGRADKRTHPTDYREAAQAAALAQIGREISIRVRSETRSWLEEGSQGGDERFSQAVQGVSSAELAGYELVDQYETDDALWVYYALDKEVYLKAVEEAERKAAAWWDRETAALEEELGSGRIQAAVDRWNRLRGRLPRSQKLEWPEPFDRMTTRLRGALGQATLRMEPREWVLHAGDAPELGRDPAARGRSGAARVLLAESVGGVESAGGAESAGGPTWKGPLSLKVTGRGAPKGEPCAVETGLEGEVSLRELFRICGMAPGTWKLEWEGPDGMRVQGEVKTRVVKAEWGLSVRARGKSGGADLAEDLEGELASRENLFFRWGAKGANRPQVDIELREAAVDSLEGVYFTTLRGKVRYPGSASPLEIHGKAGHPNRAASKTRAIQDLARNVMRLTEGN